jgi:sulfite reductase alpha subunit-like flavoprotein
MAGAAARPRVLVLYASQTGHAADAAERVAAAASRRGFAASLLSADAFDVAALPREARVVFVVATAGDGEFPDAAARLWRFLLRADLPAGALGGVRAAVFGLGDSSYAKYNAAARKLAARLAQLGAQPLCARGLGDWQSPRGVVGDLEAWLAAPDGLWAALARDAPEAAAAAAAAAAGADAPLRVRFRVAADAGGAGAARALARAEAAFPFPWPAAPPRDALAHAVLGDGAGGDGGGDDGGDGGGDDGSDEGDDGAVLAGAVAACRAGGGGGAPLPLLARVLENRRLTAQDWAQDVRHLAFGGWRDAASGARAAPTWEAGDVAVVHAENDPALVRALAARLGLPLDLVVRISADGGAEGDAQGDGGGGADGCDGSAEGGAQGGAAAACGVPASALAAPAWATLRALPEPAAAAALFPPRVTVRTLLARYLAVGAPPRRGALEALALYASDAEQAAKLRELASPDGAALFHAYVTREARSWAHVLADFDSAAPPLALLLELVPRLEARAFSAASAAAPPARLELAVGRVAYSTPLGARRAGVASAHLCALPRGARVALWLRRGALRLPARACGAPHPPLLLIGPGTGVAPMRALVHAAEAEAGAGGAGEGAAAAPPRVALFFGCRSAAADDLYGDEMRARAAASAAARARGSGGDGDGGGGNDSGAPRWAGVDDYSSSYSRDAAARGGGARDYVTDRLLERREAVRALLEAGAVVRISGSARRMPADVLAALREVLAGAPGGSDAAAARTLADMARDGRLALEAWS